VNNLTWLSDEVLVEDGEVYFGAGVFHMRVFILRLAAKDGSVIWKNDTTG
jgi:hypothetical protein